MFEKVTNIWMMMAILILSADYFPQYDFRLFINIETIIVNINQIINSNKKVKFI